MNNWGLGFPNDVAIDSLRFQFHLYRYKGKANRAIIYIKHETVMKRQESTQWQDFRYVDLWVELISKTSFGINYCQIQQTLQASVCVLNLGLTWCLNVCILHV